MKEFYTVGEVSKIYDVSTDTLRYYDKIGLLRPWQVGENGYRYYSKAQFETISTIMLLRSMGTPISDLVNAINSPSPAGITDALDNYVRNVDEEIRRLESLKKEAAVLKQNIEDVCFFDNEHSVGEDCVSSYDRSETKTCLSNENSLATGAVSTGRIKIVDVPRMWMFSKSFGDADELDIDSILTVNRLARKSWTTHANIISTITRDNLLAGNYHTYDRYGYLSETPIEVKSDYLTVIPARRCIIGSAKVHSIEHYEMDAAYEECLEYAHKNHLHIVGDAIESNILSLYSGDPFNPVMFFKIYVPVEG